MKLLNKIVLINWHYFAFQIMKLDEINFLTGKNGSGKTTLIDAIQLLILGDTTGHFFNKSASDKSSRTLKGYLRCEIGDNDKGDSVYLRNGRFTSYIAGEFYDDINDKYLTIGAVFDSFEDGNHDYKFFSYEGAIPEHSFIVNKVPLSTKELKVYLMENYYSSQINFFETNIAYREYIKAKFGNVSNSFFSLFKKAIPFSPISNIETFITEYVCDVDKNIDIDLMQDNIRNYKRLELESENLEKRIEELEKLNKIYNIWKEKDDSILTQKYVFHRSNLQIQSKELQELKEKVETGQEDLGEYALLIEKTSKEIENNSKEKEKLLEEKYSLDMYQKKADIEEKRDAINDKINELQNKINDVIYNLDNYQIQWISSISKIINFDKLDEEQLNELKDTAKGYLTEIEDFRSNLDIENLNSDYFGSLQVKMNHLKEEINGFLHHLKTRLSDNVKQQREIAISLENVDKGVKNYDYRLLKLKSILETSLGEKYNKKIEVSILADLLEIKDLEWKNAIEGYLSSQKFYLFVDPEYYDDALKIYDKVKFEHNLYDFGIVDAEKVLAANPYRQKNSLAEELSSENEYARAYIDSLLGSLIKCERVEDIRNHNRSITKTGMTYQGFVARQINKARWAKSFIGTNSLSLEKEGLEREINSLTDEVSKLRESIYSFEDISKMEVLNTNEIKSIESTLKEYEGITSLFEQKKELDDQIESLDLSYVEVLDTKINRVATKVVEFEAERTELMKGQIKLKSQIERIEEFDIPLMNSKVKESKEDIYNSFKKDWIMNVGEPFFMEELEKTKNIKTLLNFYKSKTEHIDSETKDLWENLIVFRSQYNSKYNVSYNPNSSDNTLYQEEYDDFINQKLVEYKDKIATAKANAIEQFKDDFLAKLKANFDTVKMQIDALNDALGGSKFGTDSYEFTLQPRPEYKNYFDMIMDPLLMEGHSIMDEPFQEKYRDVIDDLFRQITFADTNLDMSTRSEIERNIAKYTDYRTYLKFDLIVEDEEGRKQRLSKTLLKKSGGETQTPFYIAMLASFAQQYRVNDKNSDTIRLIVFDEAFSKMDSERIQESVKLLRNYGLQAILSAPPEKMGDIVPLVDNSICVIRDDQTTYIRNFTKNEIEELAV